MLAARIFLAAAASINRPAPPQAQAVDSSAIHKK
jgi:hypothetical protein